MSDTKIPEGSSLADWAKPVSAGDKPKSKYTQITKSGRFSPLPDKQGKSSVLKVFKTVLSALSTEQNLTVEQLQLIRGKCKEMLDGAKKSWKPLFLVNKQFNKIEKVIVLQTAKKEKEIIDSAVDSLKTLIKDDVTQLHNLKRDAALQDKNFGFSLKLPTGAKISFVKIGQEKHYTITPPDGAPIKINQKDSKTIDSLLFPDIEKTKEEILQKIKERKIHHTEPKGFSFIVETDDGRTWKVFKTGEWDDTPNERGHFYRIAQLDKSRQQCDEALEAIDPFFTKFQRDKSIDIDKLLKQF